ncbi:MAG: D-alanyl-D-alanine carboxypeptidase/D-alanyl-D-alanine-endopeptidase [Niabella sp.]
MRFLFFYFLLFTFSLTAQAQVAEKLQAAMKAFNNDSQLQFAISSLYVINGKTGEVVFDQNSKVGMAPASTEKVITAATAFDLLGTDYTYKTKFGIVSSGNGSSLYIEPSGDPSLGSWRWNETKDAMFLNQLKTALAAKGIKELQSVIINTSSWNYETISDGWIWQDIGNYYGAAALPLNWRENQFDLILRSGNNIGDAVSVVKTNPYLYDYDIISTATSASKTSGDNSYLYLPSMGRKEGILTGTIPAGQNDYVVAGSIYDPANQFVKTIINHLKESVTFKNEAWQITKKTNEQVDWFFTNTSPQMSSLVYWFLKKSINLYGEAFLKTVAFEKKRLASTDGGIDLTKNHWKKIGIDEDELHLYDGSGLSPQNRVTTHAEVTVLKYAKEQSWFSDFYKAFPTTYNGMVMKSGTINRVKGYAGYQKSKDGNEYIFSFIINNYSGSQYSVIRKMYKVLDNLK